MILAAVCAGSRAETLEGSATLEVRVAVEADQLHEKIDANTARIDAAEQRHEDLRRAVEALAQASPPEHTPEQSPEHPPAQPPTDPPIAGTGFTVFPVARDGRAVYVSAQGNDRNHGYTPDAPLRTAAAGYEKLRDGRPDRLLFRAGDTFAGNLGNLHKSGRSADEPMIIGVYENPDQPDAPRPILLSPDSSWARKNFTNTADHVAFVGLHLVADPRKRAAIAGDASMLDPDSTWKMSGISFLGDAKNITVEDCVLEYFKFALVFQSNEKQGHAKNIRLHRNIVVDSYGHWDKNIGGHSSGIYAAYIDGLTITENVWDHNGWSDKVSGAQRTKFNHNLYIQYDCTGNSVVRGNIITRGSAHGLQLRAGGEVSDNLFVRNPLAFFTGRNRSVVRRNVVLHSIDMGTDKGDWRGHGMEILPCEDALIENNLFARKGGSLDAAAAITVGYEKSYVEWLGGRPSKITIRDNKIYDWPRYDGREPTIHLGTEPQVLVNENNAIDDPDWPDPTRDVAGYMASLGREASLEAFLAEARSRPRQTWNPRFTAAAVNDFVREGFE